MKISDFAFDLPQELISKYPIDNREQDRLMVIHRETGAIEHKVFNDLLGYFGEGDSLILNDSKVLPWLLYANKDKIETKIDVTLLRELIADKNIWSAKVEPARKIRVGNRLWFDEDGKVVAEVLDNTASRGRTLKFASLPEGSIKLCELIEQIGHMPLPNYLRRKSEDVDRQFYQTVYANEGGGVVAPAAGLHLTLHMLRKFELKDVNIIPITLHIGIVALDPIDVEDVYKFRMDVERLKISDEAAKKVNETIKAGKKICSIGTSAMRAIESSVSISNQLVPTDGWVSFFIHSHNQIVLSNSLVTNFHMPKSIPLVNASAFLGQEFLMKVYDTAIKEKYKFGPYGDAMLII